MASADFLVSRFRDLTGEDAPKGLIPSWCMKLRKGFTLSDFENFVRNTHATTQKIVRDFSTLSATLLTDPIPVPDHILRGEDVSDAAMERAIRSTPQFRAQTEAAVCAGRRMFHCRGDAAAARDLVDGIVSGDRSLCEMCEGMHGWTHSRMCHFLTNMSDPLRVLEMYDSFVRRGECDGLSRALDRFRDKAGRDLTAPELASMWSELCVADDKDGFLDRYRADFTERWNRAAEKHKDLLGSRLTWSDYLSKYAGEDRLEETLTGSEEYGRLAAQLTKALAPTVTGRDPHPDAVEEIVCRCRKAAVPLRDERKVHGEITRFFMERMKTV
jgi:hypothetical protein